MSFILSSVSYCSEFGIEIMIKSLCDVRKFWYFFRPITDCPLQYCIPLNRHEGVIPKRLVKSDICFRPHLKTVTTILSLCPPSKEDGTEADRHGPTFKVTSSSKKKRKRRILSDSEEEVDASTRFVYCLNNCA
jgi:hypothetical protein